MTGAYLRVKRDGHFTNVEIEHLTKEERMALFGQRTPEELLRWIDMLCATVAACEEFPQT